MDVNSTSPTAVTKIDVMLVVLYLRLSDARNETTSFADREAKLREHADRRGWTVLRVEVENDVTRGSSKSASAFKRRRVLQPDGTYAMRVWRPGFQAVLEDLKAGRAQALLTEDLDRAMRDPRDLEDLIDVVERHKCSADSLSGSLRFTAGGTDSEITMARIMVSMANKSSRDTARRVAAARERKATAGEWGGGIRPFGFLADGVTIDPVEAAEIVKACEQVTADVPLRQIAADLRRRQIPTVKGTRWTAEALRDILMRPRNAGILVYRPEADRRREGTTKRYYTRENEVGRAPWEPIVPEDTWRAVVAKLTDPNRAMKPGPANRWLGSGIYLCVCGTAVEVLQGTKRPPAYRCRNTGSGDGGKHTVRRVAIVDEYVIKTVVHILSRPDAADLFDSPMPADVNLGELRSQLTVLRERKKSFATDYADGLIDREAMLAGTARITHRMEEIQGVLASHTDRSPWASLIGIDDVRAVWDELSLGMQRQIVRTLITVTILPMPSRGRVPFDPASIRIEWVATRGARK